MKSKSGKTKAKTKEVALKDLKPKKGAAIKGGKLLIRGTTIGC